MKSYYNGALHIGDEIVRLLHGSHEEREQGVCVMEAVAWVAGEPHSDEPECCCPVLARFCRTWNDVLPDDETRTRLLGPFVPRLVGTRSTAEVESRRSWMALDWLAREHAPEWMDLVPSLADHASALRGLPELDAKSVALCLPVLRQAAAAAPPPTPPGPPPGGADAARAAAYAAWDAAGDADAAGAAAWAAARAAAGAAIKPTTERLQLSAVNLLERMIQCEAGK